MKSNCSSRICHWAGLLFLLSLPAIALAQLDTPAALGDPSGCAHNTCAWVPSTTHKTFRSGELTYTVEMYKKEDSGGEIVFRQAGNELLRARLDGLSSNVSVVWSNDRRNFAITWTTGGEIGGIHVRVFRFQGDSIIELPATRAALDAFDERHGCEARSSNIQAYGWMPDSRTLVLALSMYPGDGCGHGYTEGYIVDAPTGKIRKRWGLKQLNAYTVAHPE